MENNCAFWLARYNPSVHLLPCIIITSRPLHPRKCPSLNENYMITLPQHHLPQWNVSTQFSRPSAKFKREAFHSKGKKKKVLLRVLKGFPGGSVVKNPVANEGDWGSCLAPLDPTCRGATKPLGHNYGACAQEPRSRNYWSLRALEPMLCNKRGHRSEKPSHHNWRVASTLWN